jgi:hypothetical protein
LRNRRKKLKFASNKQNFEKQARIIKLSIQFSNYLATNY